MKPGFLNQKKTLLALLLALTAMPALADEGGSRFPNPMQTMLAQLTPEERRVLRERWENASPEERMKMRRDFRERQMRQRDPEGERGNWTEDDSRGRKPRDEERQRGYRNSREDEGSFGMGFERRRFENLPPEDVPNPGDFFGRRPNRDSGKDR